MCDTSPAQFSSDAPAGGVHRQASFRSLLPLSWPKKLEASRGTVLMLVRSRNANAWLWGSQAAVPAYCSPRCVLVSPCPVCGVVSTLLCPLVPVRGLPSQHGSPHDASAEPSHTSWCPRPHAHDGAAGRAVSRYAGRFPCSSGSTRSQRAVPWRNCRSSPSEWMCRVSPRVDSALTLMSTGAPVCWHHECRVRWMRVCAECCRRSCQGLGGVTQQRPCPPTPCCRRAHTRRVI